MAERGGKDSGGASPPLSTWLSPEGLAVLAAAGATAALASLPVVLVPGAMAYGLVTYLRRERWKATQARAVYRPVEPPLEGLSHHLGGRVVKAVNLQKQILAEIEGAEGDERVLLLPHAERVKELVEHAAVLARQLQRIEFSLQGSGSPQKARDDERALSARMAKAQDAGAKEGYGRALEQQRAKVRVLGELQARSERIDAQLSTLELTLETVAAQVVRIKSAAAAEASAERARLAESLDSLAIDVDALADTVDETGRHDFLSRPSSPSSPNSPKER